MSELAILLARVVSISMLDATTEMFSKCFT